MYSHRISLPPTYDISQGSLNLPVPEAEITPDIPDLKKTLLLYTQGSR